MLDPMSDTGPTETDFTRARLNPFLHAVTETFTAKLMQFLPEVFFMNRYLKRMPPLPGNKIPRLF